MAKMTLEEVSQRRPFKIRNADEYDSSSVLDLFIDPTSGIAGPFDYANEIIKGNMGCGKTMYLRANYEYFLSTLVPSIIENQEIVIPIYIKLSDFQSENDAQKIYHDIIFRIIEGIIDTPERLQSAETLAKLHLGLKSSIFGAWYNAKEKSELITHLKQLSVNEYTEQMSTEICKKGSLSNKFVSACGEYKKANLVELKHSAKPSIPDIFNAYKKLLSPLSAKLLILFDEVGSVNKNFFQEAAGSSHFETIMNQLRTLSFVRTKIAIYPFTFADVLTETRYGDVIQLGEDVTGDSYDQFLGKTISLAEKYISHICESEIMLEDYFDVASDNTKLLEQIIYASNGNLRRLVNIFDATLEENFRRCYGKEKVSIGDVNSALHTLALKMELLCKGSEKDFLLDLAKACKSRSTYKFRFPNKSPALLKYTHKSEESNILGILENGSGQRGTTYYFDYMFCIHHDIPTHYIRDSEKVSRLRSREEGDWIKRVTTLNDELLLQAALPGKVEGTITLLNSDKTAGFASDEGNETESVFIWKSNVIRSDAGKQFTVGKRIRFIPLKNANGLIAEEIEIL